MQHQLAEPTTPAKGAKRHGHPEEPDEHRDPQHGHHPSRLLRSGGKADTDACNA